MVGDSDLLLKCALERDRRKYYDLLGAYESARKEAASLRERLLEAEEEAHALAVQLSALRRRLESERATAREIGTIHAVRAILPVLDDMDRLAFHADLATNTQAVKEGYRMVHENLLKALESLGVRPISSVGSPFDPNVHEAVDRLESDSYPENTVAEELQKAYEFKGTLIRSAKVRVAVKPASSRAAPE
ncbi:MAG: nucleotide exchange factor GrpE [bacterium JZ-2024 1]